MTTIIILYSAFALAAIVASYLAVLLAVEVLFEVGGGVLLSREEAFGPHYRGRTEFALVPPPRGEWGLPIIAVGHRRRVVYDGSIYEPCISTGELLFVREFLYALSLYGSPGRLPTE